MSVSLPLYLYHYTDWNGIRAIVESGYIRCSSVQYKGEATYGTGVYLTALPPVTSTVDLILNNWDDNLSKRLILTSPGIQQRVEYCIKIPTSSLRGVQRKGSTYDRDIWLYPNNFYLQGSGAVVMARKR